MGGHWSRHLNIHGKDMANDCMVVCLSDHDRHRLCSARVDSESGRGCDGTGETTVQSTRSMIHSYCPAGSVKVGPAGRMKKGRVLKV